MKDRRQPVATPCLCNALRQASRAVSRLYDEELRAVVLPTTQYSLLRLLPHAGKTRQRDLGELTLLDETILTRNLRPLVDRGWVSLRAGEDRREKLAAITGAGTAKIEEALPASERAQERMPSPMTDRAWSDALAALPALAPLADEG